MPNSLCRHVEAGVDDAVELQIGFQLGLVEGELLGAQLLLVEAPVPGGEFFVAAGLGRQPLQFRLVGGCLFQRLFPDRIEQRMDRLRRLGHGVVELQRREGVVAEQLCLLGAQRSMSRTTAVLSVAPPFWPRMVKARKAISRRSRRSEKVENGS